MTDNEIIKDFEKVVVYQGFTSSVSKTLRNTLDLIKRYEARIKELEGKVVIQQGPIDRQKANAKGLTNAVRVLNEQLSSAKAEAVKEFAERLHEYVNGIIERHEMPMFPFSVAFVSGMETKIDNLVKEMVGDNND